MAEEVIHIHRHEGSPYQDCLEIGTPGKGGAIKVYGDASDLFKFEERIKNMLTLRDMARREVER